MTDTREKISSPPTSSSRIFGTCGMRGVVGETITDEVVERLGRAFAAHLGPGQTVCVGRDTRPSGPDLEDKLVGELVRWGLRVLRLGVVSSPALYFLTRELGCHGGVMVTASHNPPHYNGFKFCDHLGMSADQEAIERWYFDPPTAPPSTAGVVEDLDGAEHFFARLREICPPPLRKLRLVVDCACGPNSRHLPAFLREQGHEVVECNCEPDVTLCNREVEPKKDTLDATVKLLHETNADAGLCFDGDNDRLVFLDREGFLGFQRGNAALAQVVLKASANKQVVGTVETGRFVEEAVRRAGGSLRRTVVGDIRVAREVRNCGAALGLEECGHYILPQIGFFSETVLPATLLLAATDINSLRAQLASMPSLEADEKRIDCPEERKEEAMKRIARAMRDLDGRIIVVDGVRVDWEDGWLLVRPSGTSPYMKVNAEAFNRERLQELVALGAGFVKEALR